VSSSDAWVHMVALRTGSGCRSGRVMSCGDLICQFGCGGGRAETRSGDDSLAKAQAGRARRKARQVWGDALKVLLVEDGKHLKAGAVGFDVSEVRRSGEGGVGGDPADRSARARAARFYLLIGAGMTSVAMWTSGKSPRRGGWVSKLIVPSHSWPTIARTAVVSCPAERACWAAKQSALTLCPKRTSTPSRRSG
jgi:hypothetical protein